MLTKDQKERNRTTRKTKIEKNRSCPMCGNPNTTLKGTIDIYQFSLCTNCLFVFSPQITPQYQAQWYAEGYHGPEDGAPKSGWSKPDFLMPIFDFLPKKESLQMLDYGTGQSFVPDKLREQGHKVVAVDIAPPLRPHPDRLTGDLLELKLGPNQFDLIFSFQVFEHLPEPRPVLDELLRLMKPGGLILIHTDMETPERDQEGFENWWYVAPPDHCAFYRHKTFEVYLEDKPAELVWKDEKKVIIQKRKV